MFARISSFVAAAALAVSLAPVAADAQFIAPIGHFPGGTTSSQGTQGIQGTQGNTHVVKSGGPKWCQTCLQTQNHATTHTNYGGGHTNFGSGRGYSAGYNYGAHSNYGSGRNTYGNGRNSFGTGRTSYTSNSLVHPSGNSLVHAGGNNLVHPLVDSSRGVWKAPAGASQALIR